MEIPIGLPSIKKVLTTAVIVVVIFAVVKLLPDAWGIKKFFTVA